MQALTLPGGAVAYTNSYIGATATTLYNIDDSLGILTTQLPPNNGTLNTVGSLGIIQNLNNQTNSLDITLDAVTGANVAYFVASDDISFSDNLCSPSTFKPERQHWSARSASVLKSTILPSKLTGRCRKK